MENFDISKITMSKVYLDEYKVSPYSEELTYTLVNGDGDDRGGSRVLRFTDDGTWSLCDKDAAIVRNHVFLEPWNGVCWYHKKWIGVFCSWVCILLIILFNILNII